MVFFRPSFAKSVRLGLLMSPHQKLDSRPGLLSRLPIWGWAGSSLTAGGPPGTGSKAVPPRQPNPAPERFGIAACGDCPDAVAIIATLAISARTTVSFISSPRRLHSIPRLIPSNARPFKQCHAAAPAQPVGRTANEVDPYKISWYDTAQQRNSVVVTIDQRLTSAITFFGEGFYTNRRFQFLNNANQSSSSKDLSVQVPTLNPIIRSARP